MAGNSIEWREGQISWPGSWEANDQALYRDYMDSILASENIQFLDEVTKYKACFDKEGNCINQNEAKQLLHDIKDNFVKPGGDNEVNLNQADITPILEAETAESTVFDKAAVHTAGMINNDLKQKQGTFNNFKDKHSPKKETLNHMADMKKIAEGSQPSVWATIGGALLDGAKAVASAIATAAVEVYKTVTEPAPTPEEATHSQSKSREINDLKVKKGDTHQQIEEKNKRLAELISKVETNMRDAIISSPENFAILSGLKEQAKSVLQNNQVAIHSVRKKDASTDKIADAALGVGRSSSMPQKAHVEQVAKNDRKQSTDPKPSTPEPTSSKPSSTARKPGKP